MLLAQLTDTHIVDPAASTDELLVDNNERLALAVARLNAETVRPDVVVATGDLTDHGSEVEMDLLRRVKRALDPEGLMNPGKVIE